jgi:coenzyme Q-binding protein COQ10
MPARISSACARRAPLSASPDAMPDYATRRRVRHAASEMFDLVADVERYPEFVPLCQSLVLRQRISEPEGVEIVVADMTVAYKLLRETFTSRVTLDRQNLQILVEYLKGPFSRMENRWEFHAVGDHVCDVKFRIVYEFKSRMLAMVMGAVFDAAFRRFAEAFERRADRIYGRRPA